MEDRWLPIWQVHERTSFFYSAPKTRYPCDKLGFLIEISPLLP